MKRLASICALTLLILLIGASAAVVQAGALRSTTEVAATTATPRPPTRTPKPTKTPRPTRTPRPTKTPRPTATPTVPVLRSGGLGLTVEEWEARYGPGVETQLGWMLYRDTWEVAPLGDHIMHIERLYSESVSVPFAQGNAGPMLPADATLVQTYSPEGRPEALVELYESPSLAAQLADEEFNTAGEAGQFIVLFKVNPAGTVDRMIIATGNNP